MEPHQQLAPTQQISYIDWLISAFQELITHNIEGNGVNENYSIYNTITNHMNKQPNINVFVLAIDMDCDDTPHYEQFDVFMKSEAYQKVANRVGKEPLSIIFWNTGKDVQEGEPTHFKAHLQQWDKGLPSYPSTLIDPYDSWQPPGSQGLLFLVQWV